MCESRASVVCREVERRAALVAGRVVDQGNVHLAGHRRSAGAGRTDLVDSPVCVVVVAEVEDSPTCCYQAHVRQRIQMIATTQDTRQSVAARR